jgi:hypothetical protein
VSWHLLVYLLIISLSILNIEGGGAGSGGDHISKEENRHLVEFFRDTYIQKVGGDKDITFCYKDGWHLYHFHHVCTRGGQDGIVTGILNADNDWSHLKSEKDGANIYTDEEWNALVIGPTLNMKVRMLYNNKCRDIYT